MEFGISIPHTGAVASPTFVRDWCQAAEEAGFDGLWGVDHVVMPHRVGSLYTLAREPAEIADGAVSELLSPNFELITTLAFVAAVTSRVRLGTAIEVLPIRNAVLNARQVATVDRYSGGRVVLGVGVGWLEEEADAMGMPWDRRGRRSEEHIGLMRALWTAEGSLVELDGEFHALPPMDPEPRPAQRSVPILVGGHSDVAIDRAARIGDGWIAAMMSPGRLEAHLAKLREACGRHGRDPDDLLVVASASRMGGRSHGEVLLDGARDELVDHLRAYDALGVHHLQVDIRADSADAMFGNLEALAEDVLPELRT